MLYRVYIESPDIANMIGIYPKTDSSHGYGNPSTLLIKQSHTKCTEISKKTRLTVTVPSACGQFISVLFIWATLFTVILSLGIGTKTPHAKTEKNKE